MIHELLHITSQAVSNQQEGIRQVLATVVDLEGSSYRKPGVRMLMDELGNMTGAVSGGCVEKEVLRRTQSVFEDGQARLMTYDGRYRLGCEGVLYILLEPFFVSEELEKALDQNDRLRTGFTVNSYFEKEDGAVGPFGSTIHFNDGLSYSFTEQPLRENQNQLQLFSQQFKPRFKLLIIGGEHDSVKLCSMAQLMGWEVEVITSWKEPRQLTDFPGADKVVAAHPDTVSLEGIDSETAVVIMSHNFSLDLKYLLKLKNYEPAYLGIIGSSARRDKLQDQLLNLSPDTSLEFVEQIYSPAGLDIGAITPEEIALSILSEIMATVRNRVPQSLKDRAARIPSKDAG